MNWLIKLGQWWENRQVLRKTDLELIQEEYKRRSGLIDELWRNLDNRTTVLETAKISDSLIKELALIKVRLDRLELLTGLKREVAPSHVNGTARIE